VIAVLALRSLAWTVAGSVVLPSDGLESIVNVATEIAAPIAVRVAQTTNQHCEAKTPRTPVPTGRAHRR
jgi:divalent metal cation (Fe/Co/Zn/Cd) transporter